MVRPRCFLPWPTKKFSLQNGEKTEERNWASFLDKNAHVQLHLHSRCFSSHFFSLTLPTSFFLLIYWASLSSFLSFFLFIFFIFFIYGHDFYFLINLGDWIFFWFFITFWVLIGHHFFNKGIYVNLYKLTYSILPFFHSQPNKKEEN